MKALLLLITPLLVLAPGVFAGAAPPNAGADISAEILDQLLGNLRKQALQSVPEEPLESEDTQLLAWRDNLDLALVEAQTHRRPVLIKFGAEWCGWCKELDKAMGEPKSRRALSDWVLTYVDLDRSPEVARRFRVQGVPALRVLAPHGGVIASQDGYLPASELRAWLGRQQTEALASRSPEELYGAGAPNELQRKLLMGAIAERDPSVREIAIRRLIDYPAETRHDVIAAIESPRLMCQLSALEVLDAWNAPIEGLDPWRADTLTEARLNRLRDWSTLQPNQPLGATADFTEEQWERVRVLLEELVTTDPQNVRALLPRLRRHGEAIAPEVCRRLDEADPGVATQRLRELRYWIAADARRVLRWPAGLKALASSDLATRRAAADALAGIATPDDQKLLLAIFTDADPLVRELALRGLTTRIGADSVGALVDLLKDPSANVRAAVLKQLTETELSGMSGEVAAYATTEADADLVVHAARYLRVVHNEQAAEALTSLAAHSSWQVRAEAAEALSEFVDNDYEDRYPETLKEAVYEALATLLADEDAFVVSRAMPGAREVDRAPPATLAAIIGRHPELATEVTRLLASSGGGEEELMRLTEHKQEGVRLAALKGLQRSSAVSLGAAVLRSLRDSSPQVRSKAAEISFNACRQAMPSFGEEGNRGDRSFSSSRSTIVGSIWNLFSFGGEASPGPASVDEEGSADPPEAGLLLEGAAPQFAEIEAEPPAGLQPAEPAGQRTPAVNPEPTVEQRQREWIEQFRAGKHRPEWLTEAIPDLERLMREEAPEPRLWAAAALVALRDDQEGFSLLGESVSSRPQTSKVFTRILPWLDKERWQAAIQQVLPHLDSESELGQLLAQARLTPSQATIDLHWDLLAEEPAPERLWRVELAYRGLLASYFGENFDLDELAEPVRERLAKDAEQRITDARSDAQRLVALAALLASAPNETVGAAARIAADPDSSDAVRASALQFELLAEVSEREGKRRAIGVIESSTQTGPSTVAALKYLAFGADAMNPLAHYGVDYLESPTQGRSYWHSPGGQIRVPKPPIGLEAVVLERAAESSDRETAALAAYFLVLLDQPRRLPKLVNYWQEGANKSGSESWHKLAYEAIAYADATEWVGELEKIYEQHYQEHTWRAPEFYWTIRMMSGDEVVALRKRVRDEVGASNLR